MVFLLDLLRRRNAMIRKIALIAATSIAVVSASAAVAAKHSGHGAYAAGRSYQSEGKSQQFPDRPYFDNNGKTNYQPYPNEPYPDRPYGDPDSW